MAIDPFSIAVSGMVGLCLKIGYDSLRERLNRKAELNAIGYLSVQGTWFAAWQTSVDGQPNVNVEEVVIVQKGGSLSIRNTDISPDNPQGGYLWHGTLKFCAGRRALGIYLPVDRSDRDSQGVLYLIYNSPRKLFVGEWVGSSYDAELCRGYAVIAKEGDQARRILQKLLAHQPVNAIIEAEQALPISGATHRAQALNDDRH